MNSQQNIYRQMNQLKYRVRITPGYKYSQLQGPFTSTRRKLFAVFIAILIFVSVATIYYLTLQKRNTDDGNGGKFFHQNRGSIVANGKECAKIGASIFQKGGSVADAAISTVLCEGVTCPQSTGLGGGFLMTIYIKERNLVECLDAREVAPLAADGNLFVNKSSKASVQGGLSVAVPGELKGLWELHKKYGKLQWSELVKPVIELCRNGHEVTDYLSRVLKLMKNQIMGMQSLREIFINPESGQLWKTGDKIKRLQLAKTLEEIAENGADSFYEGEIAKQLVKDVRNFNGILTEEDLRNYKVQWTQPLVANLTASGEKLYTMPLPGSGALLIFIMNVLKEFSLSNDDALSYHRIIETFKFAFARKAELGDSNFWPYSEELVRNLTSIEYANAVRMKIDDKFTHDAEYYGANSIPADDHGTAHIAILAPNGDAISVTSTINLIFGSLIRSKTGVILNDEMDDFTFFDPTKTHQSESNFIKANKRPMSSMSPSIIIDKDGQVRMVLGSAGGQRILTAIAQTLINFYLIKSNDNLNEIFATKRLHHQLYPNVIYFEEGFNSNVLAELQKKNHTLKMTNEFGFGALIGILVDDMKRVSSAFDPRRGGSIEFF